MAVLLTGTASLTLPTKSQRTARKQHPRWTEHKIITGEGTFRQFLKSQWLATPRGHCDLKVSGNYPIPTCLTPQKMWHLQTKLMTHWVTSTHILYPTLGHALVLCKKDGYQSCFSCYHCFHLYPSQHVWTTLSILLRNPIKKSNCNYPRMSVLGCQASAAVTTVDPYSIYINGVTQLLKMDYFCTQYWCHNFVEMQLNRLPMTWRFSVSSKGDSNIAGCSASSSEGDCNTIVFAWVLDLVPYGCTCRGVVKPLVGFFTSRVGRMVSGSGLDGISLPCVF